MKQPRRKQAKRAKLPAKQASLASILPQYNAIVGAFSLIEVAEAEIARARRLWPKAKRRLWHSFMLLRPCVGMEGMSLLYRKHCRTLLRRVALRRDTRPPTPAEILAVLSAASFQAPPTQGTACLMLRCFSKVFPKKATAIIEPKQRAALERVHGADADHVLTQLRKKLLVKDRVLQRIQSEHIVEFGDELLRP